MAELAPLSILITADADDLKAELSAAKAAISKFEAQAAKGGTKAKGFGTALSSLGNISNSTRAKIQMTSFQLQDIIVQMQMGTRTSTVLAQQLPQLAGAFGAVGAVVGVLAGIGIPALAIAFSDAGTDGRKLEEVMGDLEEAVGNVDSATSIALSSLEDLRKKYGENAEAVRALFRELVLVNQQQSLNAMNASIIAASNELDGLTGALGEFSQARRELLEAKDLVDIGLGPLPSEIKAMEQAVSDAAAKLQTEFGLTSAQAYRIVEALQAVDSAAGPEEAAGAAEQLAQAISQAAAEGAELDGVMAGVASSAARAYAAFSQVIEAGKQASFAPGLNPTMDATSLLPPPLKEPRTRRGGGGGARDNTEAELAKLQQLLMTKEELEIASFERQQVTLQEALEKRLLTQEEYNALIEEAQSRHNDNMASIDAYRHGDALQATGKFMGDTAKALSRGNSKMVEIGRKFAAIEATINAGRAFAQVAADPSLPWFAKIPAALGVASAVSSFASQSGIGGGGGGGAAAATAAATAASSSPLQVAISGISPDSLLTGASITSLFDKLQDEAGDRGLSLVFTS